MSSAMHRAPSVSADISEMRAIQQRAIAASLRDAEWQSRMLSASSVASPRPLAPAPHFPPIPSSHAQQQQPSPLRNVPPPSRAQTVEKRQPLEPQRNQQKHVHAPKPKPPKSEPEQAPQKSPSNSSSHAGSIPPPRKVIRRHRMTKEEEARFRPEQLVSLTGTTAAKSRKMGAEEHDVMLHKRRLRNRASAARSREKQRKTITDVGEEVDELVEMATAIRARAERLEARNSNAEVDTAAQTRLSAQLAAARAEVEMLRKENAELRAAAERAKAAAVQAAAAAQAAAQAASAPALFLEPMKAANLTVNEGTTAFVHAQGLFTSASSGALAQMMSTLPPTMPGAGTVNALGTGLSGGAGTGMTAGVPPRRPSLRRERSTLHLSVSSDMLDKMGLSTGTALAAVTSAGNLAAMAAAAAAAMPPTQGGLGATQSPSRASGAGLMSMPSRSFSSLQFNLSSDNLAGGSTTTTTTVAIPPLPPTFPRNSFSFFERLLEGNVAAAAPMTGSQPDVQ